MSTGTIIGIAAVVVLAVIILAGGIFLVVNSGGDDDDTAASTSTTTQPTTTEEDGPSSTEEDDPPPSTEEDDPPPSTEEDDPDGPTMDGGTDVVTGELDGTNSNFHDVDIPDGVTATITVAPLDDDVDIVVSDGEETLDDELRGEPEVFTLVGPVSGTLEISSFFGDPGPYEIRIDAS